MGQYAFRAFAAAWLVAAVAAESFVCLAIAALWVALDANDETGG